MKEMNPCQYENKYYTIRKSEIVLTFWKAESKWDCTDNKQDQRKQQPEPI